MNVFKDLNVVEIIACIKDYLQILDYFPKIILGFILSVIFGVVICSILCTASIILMRLVYFFDYMLHNFIKWIKNK